MNEKYVSRENNPKRFVEGLYVSMPALVVAPKYFILVKWLIDFLLLYDYTLAADAKANS